MKILKSRLSTLRKTEPSWFMVGAMDDLDNDITYTIDDAMDDGELLPNRYQKKATITQKDWN